MAETVHLFAKFNGGNVEGESTQTSLGREGSVECLSFTDSVRTAREKGSGLATGRRTYEPIVFRKRIDKSSPLFAKALCANEVVEGIFKFYRPNREGDGTTEQFFTISISKGRISHITRHSPDTIDPASAAEPPTEEIGIVFHSIEWTYEDGGVTHLDEWDKQT